MRRRILVIGYRESENEAPRAGWQGYGMNTPVFPEYSLTSLWAPA